jgi:hypothetical protein
VHLGYFTYICLSVSKLPLQCAVVSLYSVVKQRLKCNTGKVCNCLIPLLLTVVLAIEELVISRNLWPAHSILLYQSFICGKQQILQCNVIVHAR